MCDFVSWIEKTIDGKKEILFLTNKEINSRRGHEMAEENPGFHRDAVGHGAIRAFYGVKGGKQHEFSGGSTNHYPPMIVKAVKACKFTDVPGAYDARFLQGKAMEEFVKYKDKVRDDWHLSSIDSFRSFEKRIRARFWKLFMDKKNRADGWK